MRIRQWTCYLVALTITWGAAAGAYAEGGIKGSVKWDGKKPKRKKIKTDADPYCDSLYKDEALRSFKPIVVNENSTLKSVFVYVKSGLPAGKKWDVPADPAVLDQHGCRYVPHVFGIMAGQELVIRNSDDTSHNVNCSPKQNQGFNQGQPKKGMEFKKQFSNTEMMVPFKCDVHPWMSAFCAVMDHPFFAATDDSGGFEITGLPAGEYVLAAWHENSRMKTQEMTVVIQDGATADATFTFSRPTKGGADASDILDSEIILAGDEPGCNKPHAKDGAAKPSCCPKTTVVEFDPDSSAAH